ncbi:MAG: hypothetical protein LUG91_10785 [Ruminococcus sp.]|nr:hypothetical protein [Ruminococcus sp.]
MKKLKKVMASVLAATTMAVGMTAVSANATDGYRSFSPDSTAGLSVSSTIIYASTSCSVTCSSITAQITSTTGGTITSGDTLKTNYNDDFASVRGYGTGFTKASSSHEVVILSSGSTGSTTMTVSK